MKFLSYINGISYVFEGFMINEFTYPLPCSPAQIVPFNQPRNVTYQTCAFVGNTPGSLVVQGKDYLDKAFGYSYAHIGRNVGVVVAFSVLYLVPTLIAAELLPFAGSGGGGMTVFAKTERARKRARQVEVGVDDVEAGAVAVEKPGVSTLSSASDLTAGEGEERKEFEEKPVCTWRDVHYTIDGHHLLDGIDGFVKPGEMTVSD